MVITVFEGKIILAPLAGITERVFRLLCREAGADCVVSEMVSADGLMHGSRATAELLTLESRERPVGIQLFGSDPGCMAEAAALVEERVHPDFIDLNAGCPVRKVVSRNGGAALLRNPSLFGRIVEAMVQAVSVPVTVKIRSGWQYGEWVDERFATIAWQKGAAAVTLHARSKSMGFSGRALWERIALVKKAVDIPVIGNGDVDSPEAARALFERSGCDSVMVGRAAMGAPWIFSRIRSYLDHGVAATPSIGYRMRIARLHLERYLVVYGEDRTLREMKKHLAWYTRGVSGASKLRDALFRAESTQCFEEILHQVAAGGAGTGGDYD